MTPIARNFQPPTAPGRLYHGEGRMLRKVIEQGQPAIGAGQADRLLTARFIAA